MGVLSPTAPAVVWTCPECGHGSSEPRDRLAHLDAHRQLRLFLEQWEGSVAADAAAERRRKRQPVLYGIGVLVAIVLLATLAVATSGVGRVGPLPGAGGVPGANLPGAAPPAPTAGTPPTTPRTPPITAGTPPTTVGTPPATAQGAPPALSGGAGSPPAVRPAPDGMAPPATSATDPFAAPPGPSSDSAPAPGPSVSPPPPPAPAAPLLQLRICVLSLCLAVG